MAVDEAILESIGRGDSPPTLRLYAWHPPCLSLGYAQPFTDVDQAAIEAHAWDVVRRPTGGRAILHTDELTYCVAGPQSEPRLAGGVLESYRILAQALLRALHLLGISARALQKPAGEGSDGGGEPPERELNPVCFEVPSNYEITVGGKKLIGSAQARRKEGVLQHGSLPLCGDLARVVQALSFPDEAARRQAALRLLERATTAEACLGASLSWQAAAQAFVSAFQETLNLELKLEPLTPRELARAESLVHEKYAHPQWTERV